MARDEVPDSVPEILADCPGTPNCVSSQAGDRSRRVAPISCHGTGSETLGQLRQWIESTAGVSVVKSTDTYLRAEYTSTFLGFVDVLELLVDRDDKVIHVRSASRVGSFDFGVNRRRVEALRMRLERLHS